MPQFDYADTIGSMCNMHLARREQRLQNRAAHIISNNFDYIGIRVERTYLFDLRGHWWEPSNYVRKIIHRTQKCIHC
jgi:hypothetical protein